MKRIVSLLLTVSLCSIYALGYGPRGHRLVGAIADRRLAKNHAVAQKVSDLLDGLNLEQVATFPDDIKSWDKCNKKKKPQSTKPVTDRTRINKELRAFFNANRCDSHPSHHDFHFTDVPVLGDEEYGDGHSGNQFGLGRNKFDVVQMIQFCVRVLRGEEPQNNARAITKSVAVILLAHYLGDIHQPLHVGAQYFNDDGKPFHATKDDPGFADQGGNKLTLFTIWDKKLKSAGKFHGYWDGQTVTNAFDKESNATVANRLANDEPDDWKLNGDPETWAEQMANDILPLAREAHSRLFYTAINIDPNKHDIISGDAKERKKSGGKFYAIWAHEVVEQEIQKGGWRLAALLEAVLE